MPGSHLQYSFDLKKVKRYIGAILGFCVLRNIFIFRFKNINASAGFGAGGPKVPYTREHVLYAAQLIMAQYIWGHVGMRRRLWRLSAKYSNTPA